MFINVLVGVFFMTLVQSYHGVYLIEKGLVPLPPSFQERDLSDLCHFSRVRCEEAYDGECYRFLRYSSSKDKQLLSGEIKRNPSFIFREDAKFVLLTHKDVSFAGLNKEAFCIAFPHAFELWNPEQYERFAEKGFEILTLKF